MSSSIDKLIRKDCSFFAHRLCLLQVHGTQLCPSWCWRAFEEAGRAWKCTLRVQSIAISTKKMMFVYFFDLKKMNFTATVQCFSIFPNHWNHQKSPEFSKIQKKIGESSPLFFLFSRYKKSRILATLCCHNFWNQNLVATQKSDLQSCGNTKKTFCQ